MLVEGGVLLTTKDRLQTVSVPGTACVTCPVVHLLACVCPCLCYVCTSLHQCHQGFELLSESDSSLQEWDLH